MTTHEQYEERLTAFAREYAELLDIQFRSIGVTTMEIRERYGGTVNGQPVTRSVSLRYDFTIVFAPESMNLTVTNKQVDRSVLERYLRLLRWTPRLKHKWNVIRIWPFVDAPEEYTSLLRYPTGDEQWLAYIPFNLMNTVIARSLFAHDSIFAPHVYVIHLIPSADLIVVGQ